jgi:hypothetical protein
LLVTVPICSLRKAHARTITSALRGTQTDLSRARLWRTAALRSRLELQSRLERRR